MSRFILTIETSNAAFHPDPDVEPSEVDTYPEVARLLRLAADRIDQGQIPGALLDINGSVVGAYGFQD